MKKLILFACIICVFGLSGLAIAATVGNTADTQERGFSLGVEYDKVIKRDMTYKSGVATIDGTVTYTYPDPGETVKDVEFDSNRIFIKGTIGIHKKINLFFKLGMADAHYEYSDEIVGFVPRKAEVDADNDLAVGGGIKLNMVDTDSGFKVVSSAEYLTYKADSKIKIDGVDYSDPSLLGIPYDAETTVKEWQVALTLAKNFDKKITPYGGVKYSDLTAETEFSATAFGSTFRITEEIEADKNFGIFAGIDANLTDKVSINIEGRALDETAVTLGLNLKF